MHATSAPCSSSTTVMSFRVESKAKSSRLRRSRVDRRTSTPQPCANASSATSVGSPATRSPRSSIVRGGACSTDRCDPIGRPGRLDHRHPVGGEGAGLVGADDGRRAQGLDRAQPLDESTLPRERADTDRERESDGRQQPLGDVCDEQPDREDERAGERQAGQQAERKEGDADADGDERDQPRRAAHLLLERALLPPDALRERGDAAELGLHPRRVDERMRLACGAARPAEDEVACLEEDVGLRFADLASHRHRLAREGGGVDLEAARDEPRVGGHAIAFDEHDDVPRHEPPRLDELPPSVPQHGDALGQEGGERLDRTLRLPLLRERERRVQRTTRDDGRREERGPCSPGEGGGGPEQQCERMGQLRGHVAPPARAPSARDLVRAVANEPALGFPLGEAVRARLEIREQPALGLQGARARAVPGVPPGRRGAELACVPFTDHG